MNRREIAEAMLDDEESEALFMDGLDDAIVGIASQFPGPELVVYSRRRIHEAFVAQGMDPQEAREYSMFNVEDAYAGPGTPLILDELEDHVLGDLEDDDADPG